MDTNIPGQCWCCRGDCSFCIIATSGGEEILDFQREAFWKLDSWILQLYCMMILSHLSDMHVPQVNVTYVTMYYVCERVLLGDRIHVHGSNVKGVLFNTFHISWNRSSLIWLESNSMKFECGKESIISRKWRGGIDYIMIVSSDFFGEAWFDEFTCNGAFFSGLHWLWLYIGPVFSQKKNPWM